jgi:hypothetical protein
LRYNDDGMRAHAVVLLAVLEAGCGTGAPAAPAPVNATAGTYDGTWTGQTEQGQPVAFSISGNQIKTLDFEFQYAGDASCPRFGSGRFGESGSFGKITNGVFSIVSPSTTGSQVRWVVSGAFVSSTLARGLVEFTVPSSIGYPPSCPAAVKAAWVAGKS